MNKGYLEALEKLGRYALYEMYNELQVNETDEFDIVQQALLKSQEQEKVLKIIKEKNVDIIMIRMSETLDKYNRMIYKDNFNRKELTQEEFDILKEELECQD